MGTKTWIYITILIVVLLGAGIFFWWIYNKGQITPTAGPTPTPTPTTFSDVPSTSQFFKEIEAVNKAGYMVGYKEFKPEEQATRATAAIIVAQTYGKVASPAPQTSSFSDVSTTDPAFAAIEGLKAAGWVEGYPDGTFQPTIPLTRGDAITFAAIAKAGGKSNVPEATNVMPFSDVKADDPALKYIIYAKEQGITTGFPDGTFKSGDPATRATMASFVAKAHGDSYDNPSPSFMDVARDYWAYKEIEGLYKIGGLSGYPPTFKPTVVADRATLAVVIARATSNIFDNPTPTFKDAGYDKNFWAYQEIEGVNKAGFMTGYGDGTFKPNQAITRTDAAIVLARAKGLTLDPAPATPTFSDVSATDNGYKEIEAIYKAGYTKGCESTKDASGNDVLKFCPTTEVTREVLAAFTYNAFIASGITSPSPNPSPSVASPTPTATISPTPTATPTETTTTTTGTTGTTGSTGTTSTAQTGPEIPLVSGGLLSILLLGRYLISRRIR